MRALPNKRTLRNRLKNSILGELENNSKPNYIAEISSKGENHLGCNSRKILGTILEVNEKRTSTNDPEKKKTYDDA